MDHQNVVFGSGPLGIAVVNKLVSQGKKVILVNRSGTVSYELHGNVSVVSCDATNASAVAEICNGSQVVYHCAAPPYTEWPEKFPQITQGILEGVSRSKSKFVFGDNLYMYGPNNGKPLHEDLPYHATGHKGKVRAEMAEMLMQAHKAGKVQVTIGRGSDFYGPTVLNSAVGEILFGAALAGKPANLLGNVDQPHTLTYITDFGNALVTLGENEAAFGKIWHVPSAETITTREFVKLIEKEIDNSVTIRAAGGALVSIIGLFSPLMRELKEVLYQWEEPFIVDHSHFEAAFGAKTTPHEEAIKETVAWYKKQNHFTN